MGYRAPLLRSDSGNDAIENEAQRIIALYANHGTSEQFHSELKTDLGMGRLPSGKFATNALVLAVGQLAYNLPRWIGQQGLLGADAPQRRTSAAAHRPAGR